MAEDRKSPPLLFVHGAWHGKWCYEENFLAYFSDRGFDVHAIDLPHHGEKFTNARALRWLTIADYVTAVAHYAATLPARPVVIGHSMGGFVVQKYLESYTAPGGVLLASVPPKGVLRLTLDMARRHPIPLLKTNLTLSLSPLIATPQLAKELFFSDTISPALLERYYARLHEESYRAYLDYLFLNLVDPKRVKTPMLVMGGANDTIFTVAEIEATAAAYDTKAIVFPNMAHDMMLEPGWEKVADHIAAWVKNLAAAN